MESDPPCPACLNIGRMTGYDRKRREVFACRTEGCDVAAYDRDLVRRRLGLPAIPPARVKPPSPSRTST